MICLLSDHSYFQIMNYTILFETPFTLINCRSANNIHFNGSSTSCRILVKPLKNDQSGDWVCRYYQAEGLLKTVVDTPVCTKMALLSTTLSTSPRPCRQHWTGLGGFMGQSLLLRVSRGTEITLHRRI